MKISAQIILSPEAEEQYITLIKQAPISKKERMILDAFNKKKELLKENPRYGNPIAKKLIPQEYRTKYALTNLFRVELPAFWRMLYTLTAEGKIEIVAFILDIINHNEYNKKFRYRKK